MAAFKKSLIVLVALVALMGDPSAHIAQQLAYEGEAKALPLRFSRYEGLEDLIAQFWRHAPAHVRDGDFNRQANRLAQPDGGKD